MHTSSRDIYGVGFREVEIVEQDTNAFGKYCITGYNPEYKRHYDSIYRVKGTPQYENERLGRKAYYQKHRAEELFKSKMWRKQNRIKDNERNKRWARVSGKNKKTYLRYGKIMNTARQLSGYHRIQTYLYRRQIKPPLNFTEAYTDRPWLKKGQWAWTFAHP